ncbi:flagellin [Marinobacter sp. NSM]|uniref:flagellin n=1 Tax=Marinobacter sp. NSM TaxID=3458004 RepID=UPI0040356BB9
MALGINTNVASLNAQNQLSKSQGMNDQALQRLSSGLRINSAKDDAAGLAISERFSTQIRGLNVAQRNANDGISLAQTAEGALNEITNNLQRIRELAVQSANATNSTSDREALQAEVEQLVSEIDRVATQTEFNGLKIVDGSFNAQAFQVGANAGQTITIDSIASAKSSDLGQFRGFSETAFGIGTANDTAVAKEVTVGGQLFELGSVADDAKAIANALNSAGISGLVVSANETVTAGQASNVTGALNDADSIEINGTTINLTNTGDAASNRQAALDAINAQSSVTGVRAVDNGSGVDLLAADGRNITTAFTADDAATAADYGLAADATTGGTLDITYKAPAGVTGDFEFTTGFDAAFTTQTIAASGTALNAIDIGTVAGANTALTSVDAALDSINSARADLGAIQNRFESTISNIATTSENLSASNSRILDADFAAETANLAKSQVLQQAGISVLAQANARPQQVLSLLQ